MVFKQLLFARKGDQSATEGTRRWVDRVRLFNWITLIVLGAAAFSYLFPTGVILIMVTLVGIPLALALNFLAIAWPAVLIGLPVFWVLTLIFVRVWRILLWGGALGAAAIFLMWSTISVNAPGRVTAQALIAGDHDDLVSPVGDRFVFGYLRGWRLPDKCDVTCMRLLLSGRASAVVIAKPSWKGIPDRLAIARDAPLSWPATRWWMERTGAPCDQNVLVNGNDLLGSYGADAASPQLVMKARLVAGECLLSAPATLAEADIALARLTLQNVHQNSDFVTGVAALDVHRVQLWQRRDGQLKETYRRTGVTAWEVYPWKVSIWQWNGFSSKDLGYPRKDTRWKRLTKLQDLLADRLGLTLKLPTQESANSAIVPQIDAMLDTPGTLEPAQATLLKAFQDQFGPKRLISAGEWPLMLRLLGDPRADLDYWSSTATGAYAQAHPEVQAALTRVVFARLANVQEGQITTLAYAVSELPFDRLAPYRDQFFSLAHDPERRKYAYPFLERLGEFGPEGKAELLHLIDVSQSGGHYEDNTYRAGLIGLCRMGHDAQDLAPDLLDRIRSGKIYTGSKMSGELALKTLVQLGVPTEKFRQFFLEGEDPMTEKLFDAKVLRYTERPYCG